MTMLKRYPTSWVTAEGLPFNSMEADIWYRDGRTVFVLNEHGTNRYMFRVDKGSGTEQESLLIAEELVGFLNMGRLGKV
jgi:hypothetical protein